MDKKILEAYGRGYLAGLNFVKKSAFAHDGDLEKIIRSILVMEKSIKDEINED